MSVFGVAAIWSLLAGGAGFAAGFIVRGVVPPAEVKRKPAQWVPAVGDPVIYRHPSRGWKHGAIYSIGDRWIRVMRDDDYTVTIHPSQVAPSDAAQALNISAVVLHNREKTGD